jgi:hypothetical protein
MLGGREAQSITRVEVTGFLPSTSGFHFPNAFPGGPVLRFGLGRVRIPIGNAADGLCGGVIFAARDLFEAGVAPPLDTQPPPPGSALFRYVVRRLFHSFDLPSGPLRYLAWMTLPADDLRMGVSGLTSRSLRRQWPRVKRDLDRGLLSPLGLVRVRSLNPLEVGRNHQVLAYGYEVQSHRVSVRVYDPNHPDADDLRLTFDANAPADSAIDYIEGELPVRGFFRTRYRPAQPPAASVSSFPKRSTTP